MSSERERRREEKVAMMFFLYIKDLPPDVFLQNLNSLPILCQLVDLVKISQDFHKIPNFVLDVHDNVREEHILKHVCFHRKYLPTIEEYKLPFLFIHMLHNTILLSPLDALLAQTTILIFVAMYVNAKKSSLQNIPPTIFCSPHSLG